MTILNAIFRSARLWPDKPAMLLADRIVTYRMLVGSTLAVAAKLRQLELTKHDLVAIDVNDPARHVVVALALFQLGIPSVSIRSELRGFATTLGTRLILVDEFESGHPAFNQQHVTDDWFIASEGAEASVNATAFGENDVCRVSITSGSTGLPKAVAQTEVSVWRRIQERLSSSLAQPWPRTLCMAGLSTNFGFARALLPLCIGQTTCFATSAEEALHMTSVYGIHQLVGSPAQLTAAAAAMAGMRFPIPSLDSIICGGGPLNSALVTRLRSELCATVIDSYSSTEGGGAGIAAGDFLLRRGDRLLFLPVKDIRIVGPGGEALPAGKEGHVQVRSDSYASPWRGLSGFEPANTAWCAPGDLGRLDSSGCLEIMGRSDDVLNIGGVKVNSEAVQQVISTYPGIRDAGVVAAMGARGNPELWAAVVADIAPNADDLAVWLEARIPGARLAKVAVVQSVPRSHLGKLMRGELRRQLEGHV
ncbi:MAG: putative AMP-dependent ligase [Hyphomicrobiales bacterium]|nr:putative AMP-dependent ligase [Hyphomicrobiales bacterium]